MCLGGGDNGAADAAREQTRLAEALNAKHDKAVSDGKFAIDDAFKSFDDNYYRDFSKTYRDTYNPQLDDQFSIARDNLSAILAGRETLDSSIGADALAR